MGIAAVLLCVYLRILHGLYHILSRVWLPFANHVAFSNCIHLNTHTVSNFIRIKVELSCIFLLNNVSINPNTSNYHRILHEIILVPPGMKVFHPGVSDHTVWVDFSRGGKNLRNSFLGVRVNVDFFLFIFYTE